VSEAFPEPTEAHADRGEVLVGYLDYFRARILEKVSALPADESDVGRLPSGWTPLQLLKHLTFVEHRWLEWGFEGQASPDPWGDERDGRWFMPEHENLTDLAQALEAQRQRTRAIVACHALNEPGQPGPRWDGRAPATLERVLLHLLQEYARHLGQLDIVTELAGGPTGE
jgi:uncharacterized damage-inducible protein DinB